VERETRMANPLDQVFTPAEVAERLKVSSKTVKDWLRAGKLRGVKAGRLWRVRERDLEEFLEKSLGK